MSGFDGYTDEMGYFTEPSDEDLDRLLSGLAPADDGFDELATLVRDVQSACFVTLDGSAEDRHVMPVVAAAQLLEPVDIVAPRSRRWAGGLPAWRRRTVFGSLFASLSAKVAGVAVASTMAAGGFAATGTLPDPAQTAVANVVEKIGITIPNPDKAEEKAEDKAAKAEQKAEDKAAKAEQKAEDKAARAEEKVETEDGETGTTNGKSVAEYVHEALDEEYESGRAKGEAVSEAASRNRQNDKAGEASEAKNEDKAPEGDDTSEGDEISDDTK